MKKFTLIVCALATTVASFANVKVAPQKKFMRSTVPSISYVEAQFDKASAEKKTAALDTVYLQYRPLGAYQVACPDDGLLYGFYQQGLIAPYMDTIYYLNNDTLPCSWYLGGNEVKANSPFYAMKVGFGEFELPVMKTPATKTTYYADYQVAALATADWQTLSPDFYNALNVAPAYEVTFTKCAMYTERPKDSRGYDTDGSDWKLVGAGDLGSYSFGSKLTNPWDGGYFDTIIVPYFQEKNNAMYIDHITMGIWNNGTSSADFFPGENDHVRLSIYPFTENGAIDWKNPIAQATANLDNFTPYYTGYTYLGLLQFNFKEIDPITGAESTVPAIVSGDFVVALDEYNNGTTNVGFICDYFSEFPSQTYFVGRDSGTGKQYTTTLWSSPSNIMMNLTAYLSSFNTPETVKIGLEGGEINLKVPSNVWDEDIEFDAEDWIDVEITSEYTTDGEYYYHQFVNDVKITVDAASAPRLGTIEFNALGVEATITVNQGGEQGIDVIKAVNDNKMYNVLGIEVGEDYKGVVIRNGEKFVR